jgi:hypothetical protein
MGSARYFTNRAPRYTLRPSDNRYLRFAHENEHGHTHTTLFLDISETGLAFVADRPVAPHVSEKIKIEVPLDDGQSVAWWGRVVRVEEYAPHRWHMKGHELAAPDQVLVAVTFDGLPEGHTAAIRTSLQKRFEFLYRHKTLERWQSISTLFIEQFWRLFLYGVCIFGAAWFLYSISQPSKNYDAKRGAPWGQRFPELNIFEDESK